MIKKCANPSCRKEFEGSPRKRYCSPKCKKFVENSKRAAPGKKEKTRLQSGKGLPPSSDNRPQDIPSNITKPDNLNPIASAYWDKVAPVLIKRGHLNVLSEDAFAELCDLHSRLIDIRKAIDETNRSLLQIDDKWDNKTGTETQSFKESALSDIKRKYSARFLDYCKQFYLTPAANRGNFNLEEDEPEDEKAKGKERFF